MCWSQSSHSGLGPDAASLAPRVNGRMISEIVVQDNQRTEVSREQGSTSWAVLTGNGLL